ncbi:MAG: class I SAM-dependent methyltransferase [Candidatus Schekmanbacteria bacterium]|nr:class I SAM-dependent methyltransferase [Candidatus Schekmanbacteria bacterium]
MKIVQELYAYYNKKEKAIKKTVFHPAYAEIRHAVKRCKENAYLAKGILLDLGCGTMPYKDIFNPKVERYIAFDYPVVQETLPDFEKPDVCGNSLYLPFVNDSFDTILCFSVIEHIPDPFQMISEISRVMKKGAILILTGPGIACQVHGAPYDYVRLTEYGYSYLFEKCGLKIEKTYYCGYLLASMAKLFNTFIIKYPYKGRAYKKVFQIIFLPLTFLLIAMVNLFAIVADKIFMAKEYCPFYFFVARKE